jgi:hypothetical protein
VHSLAASQVCQDVEQGTGMASRVELSRDGGAAFSAQLAAGSFWFSASYLLSSITSCLAVFSDPLQKGPVDKGIE